MSELIAFHGNPALKQQCISRIEKQRDSNSIGPVLRAAWMPEYSMCTLTGALLESSEIEQLQEATGLPPYLVQMAQTLLGAATVSAPDKKYADSLQTAPPQYLLPESLRGQWTAWIEAIPVGSKVPDIFPDVMSAILRGLASAEHAVAPLPSDIQALLVDVIQLFDAQARGETVTAQQWKSVRTRCVALTDAGKGTEGQSEFTQPIAVFLESLCWSWDGDYTEPFQSLRGLADHLTYLLASRLESQADKEIIAGQRRVMEQYVTEASKDPSFDVEGFFARSEAAKAYWHFDFQQLMASNKLQMVPFVGGRMLTEFLNCLKARLGT